MTRWLAAIFIGFALSAGAWDGDKPKKPPEKPKPTPPPSVVVAPVAEAASTSNAAAKAGSRSDSQSVSGAVAKGGDGGNSRASVQGVRADGGAATANSKGGAGGHGGKGGTGEGGDSESTSRATGGDSSNSMVSSYTYTAAAATAIAGGLGNNTDSCIRVLGLGGSTLDQSWAIGWPIAGRGCQLEKAAAMAFKLQGPMSSVGWNLFCHQPGVKHTYGARWWRPGDAQPAVDRCLVETTTIAAIKLLEERLEDLRQELSACEDCVDTAVYDLIAALEQRVRTVEDLAHPQGKGLTASFVRELIKEEAPCGAEGFCPTTTDEELMVDYGP